MILVADKTSTGLKKETAGALAYTLGPITGVLLLLLEKDPFVRFHAMQSIIVFGTYIIFEILFGVIPVIGLGFSSLLTLLAFILWLILMYKASEGEKWKVPMLGEYVEKFL